MRYVAFIALIIFPFIASCQSVDKNCIVVSVKRNYKIPTTETAQLIFSWPELFRRNPSLKPSNLLVTDQHFGKVVAANINDANADGKPEGVVINYKFMSNEPVFAFLITSNGKGAPISAEGLSADSRFEIEYLVPVVSNSKESFSDKIVQSTIHTYPDAKDLSIISPGKWTYEYGFFLNATFKLYQQTRNEKYLSYVKLWVDNFITDEGKFKDGVYDMSEYRLDDILPGRLCIYLYQQTGEKKYKAVADQFIQHLTQQPKTTDGGYWHKQIYPNQMWLDGIYMGDIFSMQYAAAFNEPKWFDEAVSQINLIYKHNYDPATGLLFHGWDESKNKVWADQTTGASPELWSRAIGWYAMALIECLDYLPAGHPERKSTEEIFQKLCKDILKFQDKKSGLWYQVINKGNLPDNWIETSASAMFTYAFAKGNAKGLLDKSYKDAATKGFDSILARYIYTDSGNYIHLDQAVKVGSLNMKNSKGDYAYYVTCERRLDDYKGLAALLYTSIELGR